MQIVSNPYSTQINPGGASAASAVNGIASAFLDTATPALRAAALAAQQRELAAKTGVASAFAGIAHGQQPDAAQFSSDLTFGNMPSAQLSDLQRNLAQYTAGNGNGSRFAQSADRTAPNYDNTPTGAADKAAFGLEAQRQKAALDLHNALATSDAGLQTGLNPDGSPGYSTTGAIRNGAAPGFRPVLSDSNAKGAIIQENLLPGGGQAGAPLNISPPAQVAGAANAPAGPAPIAPAAIPPVAPAPGDNLSPAAANVIGAADPGRGQIHNWVATMPDGTRRYGTTADPRRDKATGAMPANAQIQEPLPGTALGAKEAMDQLAESYKGVQSSIVPQLQALDRMEQNVKNGMFTGIAADHGATFAAALDQIGLGNHEKLANTQEFLNSAAQNYLGAAKRAFPGNRITNADLKVAENMTGGDNTQLASVLQRSIEVQRALAKQALQFHNDNVLRFGSAFPGFGGAASTLYQYQEPQAPAPQAAPAGVPAAPQANIPTYTIGKGWQ